MEWLRAQPKPKFRAGHTPLGGNAGYYQYLGRDGFSKLFAPGQPVMEVRQVNLTLKN